MLYHRPSSQSAVVNYGTRAYILQNCAKGDGRRSSFGGGECIRSVGVMLFTMVTRPHSGWVTTMIRESGRYFVQRSPLYTTSDQAEEKAQSMLPPVGGVGGVVNAS